MWCGWWEVGEVRGYGEGLERECPDGGRVRGGVIWQEMYCFLQEKEKEILNHREHTSGSSV